MSKENSYELVDHLFRHEHGKMVAVLTRIFGLDHLEMVEDVVQDTFYKALKSWSLSGVPKNPSGWLLQVARNGAIDKLRREKTKNNVHAVIENSGNTTSDKNVVFLDSEIKDDQLRLIFTCCHPALNWQDQIAITLKTVSGFSIREIAKALLSREGTIKKRLHRARNQIVEKNIAFTIPTGQSLPPRLHAVYSVLYLMFNEGYSSTKKDELIRKDLCGEAMRLTKILLDRGLGQTSDGKALLAMMCYHAARFESRLNSMNEMVLLPDQDRSLWNKSLVGLGNQYMNQAMDDEHYSIYHVEAAIAAEHCMAQTFNETNWDHLLTLYDILCKAKPSGFCLINKAVIYLQLNREKEAFEIIHRLQADSFGEQAYLYHCVAAEVYKKMDDYQMTRQHLEQAHKLASNQSEQQLISKRLSLMVHSTP